LETFKRKNGGGVFALSAKLCKLMQGFSQERAYLFRPLTRTNLAQKAEIAQEMGVAIGVKTLIDMIRGVEIAVEDTAGVGKVL
jgi:hypothetical protein